MLSLPDTNGINVIPYKLSNVIQVMNPIGLGGSVKNTALFFLIESHFLTIFYDKFFSLEAVK